MISHPLLGQGRGGGREGGTACGYGRYHLDLAPMAKPHSFTVVVVVGSSAGKESAGNSGDPSSIPGSGRSSGKGIGYPLQYSWDSLVAQLVKESACNVGDPSSIPGLERCPGEGNGNPFNSPIFLPGESPWTEEPGGL